MKVLNIVLMIGICLTLLACNSDAELKTLLNEKSDAVVKMAGTIDANPTAAGVDEAQKFFDAKKTDLKSRQDTIGNKISGDGLTLKYKADAFDSKTFLDLGSKHAMKLAADPDFKTKFNKLSSEIGDILKQILSDQIRVPTR